MSLGTGTKARTAHPWLAAALTLALCLAAGPARCDPAASTPLPATAALAAPSTLDWLHLLIPGLDWWLPVGPVARQPHRPPVRASDTNPPNPAPPCPPGSTDPGCTSNGGKDPDG